jgi:eukaryotic-like serine/threonine-protein kinase
MDNGGGTPQIIRFGAFEANLQTGELRKHGLKVPLQGQPFQVCAILLQQSGKLVTREELRKKLWPEDTFVDFDHGLNTAITKIRIALGDSAENPRFIETLPRRGYRFLAPAEGIGTTPTLADKAVSSSPVPLPQNTVVPRLWTLFIPATVILLVAIGGTLYFRWRHSAIHLTEKDTIVLSDFENMTGDPVFDGTLRQGLSVQLEQSPFLGLVSDQRIRQTLRLMEKPDETKLTPEISREVCQRTGSKAVIDGSIAQIGKQYSLILKAVDCSNGESLTSTEVEANDKNHVLGALGKAASEIRNKLGESLNIVQKFDTPLEQATTSSLEALQAYSLGWKIQVIQDDSVAAVPYFQRAIKLDPNFAMAHALLGTCYGNIGQRSLAAESTKKAFELRERASEREKFYIDGRYYVIITSDLEKARQGYELWARIYPRDIVPPGMLGVIYMNVGQHDKALEQTREFLRLSESGMAYSNLVEDYINMNRLEEAQATAREAQAKKLYSPILYYSLYLLAFLQNDAAGMAQQVDWAAGKPEEAGMLAFQASTAAYSGQLRKAREYSRRAVALAQDSEENEVAAGYEGAVAWREAIFGNAAEAQQRAAAVLRLSAPPLALVDAQYWAAQAWALSGDEVRAQALADDFAKRFPEATKVRFIWLPTINAQLALNRNDPLRAIELLQTGAPVELGSIGGLYPVYLRGEAYLAAHQGSEAAAEFQKIIDYRGIVRNSPIGALAHLQIGRAYSLQGDSAKARAAYQDFLTLWKDADPDIPILKQAKAEYTKLQ